jgi:hypothetical protein
VNDTIAAFFDRYLGPGEGLAQIKRAGSRPGIATTQMNAR